MSDIVRCLKCGRILCENLDDPSAQVFQIKVSRPEEDKNMQCSQLWTLNVTPEENENC